MKDIFNPEVVKELRYRINQLTPESTPEWGKMNVSQMLAHCCVTYEMAFTDKHPIPKPFVRFILKLLVKPTVVGSKPYKKNTRTAPQFLIKDDKDFDVEKNRLIDYLNQTQKLGRSYFEGKLSNSFGKLTAEEWNTMFYKHLDYHLSQFKV